MGFLGRLGDLSLTDILQVLSLGKRTGTLTLTGPDHEGTVLVRDGGIVCCRSSQVHETLGSILVNRHLITEETLREALAEQRREPGAPLGMILVRRGAITRQQLDETIREQIQRAIAELLTWQGGDFHFERLELGSNLQPSLDASEIIAAEAIRPEQVVLELLGQLDESRPVAGDEPAAAAPVTPPERRTPERPSPERDLSSLRAIMAEMRGQTLAFTGEVTLMLLRYTAELVNRAVLFAVADTHFAGIGQFGIQVADDHPDSRVRSLRIARSEPSVLEDACRRRQLFVGPLPPTPANRLLLDRLGGALPRAVIAAPVMVNGRPSAVIYGDNLPGDEPIGSIQGLELLLIEAGLLMEKQQLEARLRRLEGRAASSE